MHLAHEFGCLPIDIESRCTLDEIHEMIAYINVKNGVHTVG